MFAAHQGVGMNLNIDALELGQRGIDDGIQGFAGGVRHQMDMKFLLHKLFPIAPRIAFMPASAPCGQSQNRGCVCAISSNQDLASG